MGIDEIIIELRIEIADLDANFIAPEYSISEETYVYKVHNDIMFLKYRTLHDFIGPFTARI